MTRAAVLVTCAVLASVVALAADDMSVQVDPKTNFAAFRTFSIRNATIKSPRPELDNPLFKKRLTKTIIAALSAHGLKDVTAPPDLYVDFTLTGDDVSTTQQTPMRGVGPQPLMYTEGTLVIDLSRPGDPAPVWRGVYRDDEKTGSKLMAKLPDDARKLIAKYPKK